MIDNLRIMEPSNINSGSMKKTECQSELRIWEEDVYNSQNIKSIC